MNSLRNTNQQLRSPLIPNYHNFNNNQATHEVYKQNFINQQQEISPTSSLTSASASSSTSSTSTSPSLVIQQPNQYIKKKAIQTTTPIQTLTTASIVPTVNQLNNSINNNTSSPNLILNNQNGKVYNQPIILSSPKIHSNTVNKSSSLRSPNQTPRSRARSKSNHLKSTQNSSLNRLKKVKQFQTILQRTKFYYKHSYKSM